MPTGRRAFLGAAAATIAAACTPQSPSAAPSTAPSLGPPETTRIRIPLAAPCDPWLWLAEPLLREEGFTDIQIGGDGDPFEGTADLSVMFGNLLVTVVDAGTPVVGVAGIHTGCIEVWARPGINTVGDLRGKTFAVGKKTATAAGKTFAPSEYGFVVSLLAYVGMQPGDVNFVETANPVQALLDGKVDAVHAQGRTGPVMHGLPDNPGHVIVSTSVDKPWSQNYCCLLYANRDWAKANPVAAKRATRAILRGTDAGKRDLRAAAKAAIDKGIYAPGPFTTEQLFYDVMKDQSFEWRDYDPEDTVRFFALRLADAKLVRKTPAQIIAEGTDFAYFRQMQKELKA